MKREEETRVNRRNCKEVGENVMKCEEETQGNARKSEKIRGKGRLGPRK